jgi:hypothetical protein
MDDIHPGIRDDDRRSMTYAEIAATRGISADSAVRLVRRKRWPKQAGNNGTVRVRVPADEATPANPRPSRGQPGGQPAGHPPADILPVIRKAIREVIQPLSEQLEAANQRADDDRARADRAEEKADRLQVELVELRVSERSAADLVEYATGEATDLRQRLDAAEQWAGEERARGDQGERQLAAVEGELIAARVEAAGLRCRLEQARSKLVTEPPRSPWRRFLALRRR